MSSWMDPPQGLMAVGLLTPASVAKQLVLPVNVKRDYGASGSNASTTGSITAGSTALTLAAAEDFQNGQGISVAGALGGALLVTSIVSGAGTVNLVLATAATTTVAAAAVNHNDRVAITNAIASGNTVELSGGNYLHDGFTIPSGTTFICHDDAILWGSGPIVVGSSAAASTAFAVKLRVAAQAGSSITLVEAYNLQNGRGFGATLGVMLAANSETSDLIHIHSTHGIGFVDVVCQISTASFVCNNGIILMNGDSTIASVAGDFINGNLFLKSDLSCNIICVPIYPMGTAAGSVSGTIERNLFLRGDMNSYNTAAVKAMTAGNAGYNRFQDATFETGGGGAALDVDLVTNLNATGQIFDHIATRSYATQKLNPRDVWIFGENDTGNYIGRNWIGAGWTTLTPAVPAVNTKVTNTNPYPVHIYQSGGTGVHIVDPAGNDVELPVASGDVLVGPLGQIYFATLAPTAWNWYGI